MINKIAAVQDLDSFRVIVWFADGEARLLDVTDRLQNEGAVVRVADDDSRICWDEGTEMGWEEVYASSTHLNIVETESRRVISGVVEARHDAGLSQAKLASAAGVKQPVVARLETSVNSPRLDTLLKVLTPLGKTLKVVELSTTVDIEAASQE